MKNQIIASIAAVPFAFATATTANAVALNGQFHLSSGLLDGDASNIFLSKDSLSFTPTPTPVIIDADTNGGTFTNFNSAYISEIVSFGSTQTVNSFLDFGYLQTDINGTLTPTPGTVYTDSTDDSSLRDGFNVFNLTQANYTLDQNGANVEIDVELWGEFVSETGEVTDGAGNLTFQINNATVEDIQAQLDEGEKIGGLTFSGGLFSDTQKVPEPTTLFGLGIVAAGLTLLRRQGKKS
ncbi:PEP-CTERM sorting domain-containing protein [Dapis sp. BLCC M229]|uniref:PEP-CTERM sorting domain-containing protein n=1 Tax=Dapis sp. BLCC M229 TaxID=3400188 RepID=UPI003CEE026A